ncbi:MAG TPA: hypothetical protein V6D28_21310 [Leptolyngbyaceae cyanobacterium]
MVTGRLLYEYSVTHQGHLIIPFVYGVADREEIYSYQLLSELGCRGKFHKVENPAGFYASNVYSIITIAKDHLDEHSDVIDSLDLFKIRYTYRHNLIIVSQLAGKYFYDHYPPKELMNIAAPKIFPSEIDCINWVKQGLDRSHSQHNTSLS